MRSFASPPPRSHAVATTEKSYSDPDFFEPDSARRKSGSEYDFLALLLVLLPVCGAQAQEAELPRWELGAGVSAFHVPDYRGADEGRAYTIPFPFFIYRGERVRADRDGLRGELFETDRVDLNVSVGLGVPVRSEDNLARRGMPSLDPVLEVGPSLNIVLARSEDHRTDWQLRLPIRVATAFDDFRARDAGLVFSPRLRWSQRDAPWAAGATVRVSLGPDFATRRYHAYVYDVAPQFATATRPAYRADGGFSGVSIAISVDRTIGRHRVFGFVVGDSVRGAAYEDSPLVRRSSNVSVGFAYAYVFAKGGVSQAPPLKTY
jgi:MipA family protein